MRKTIGFLLAFPSPAVISIQSTGAGWFGSLLACALFVAALWKGLTLLCEE